MQKREHSCHLHTQRAYSISKNATAAVLVMHLCGPVSMPQLSATAAHFLVLFMPCQITQHRSAATTYHNLHAVSFVLNALSFTCITQPPVISIVQVLLPELHTPASMFALGL